jgi:N-methylhydantoinase A
MGMLMADERHDAVRTYPAALDTLDFSDLGRVVDELEVDLRKMCRSRDASIVCQLDLRYVGQEFSLSVPVTRDVIARGDRTGIRATFNAMHEQRYAHSADDEPVEMINLRLVASARREKPAMPTPGTEPSSVRHRKVVMGRGPAVDCQILERASLAAGTLIKGPALIQEYGSTTVIFPQDQCIVAATGELIITVQA